jgi:hypothetical protein
MLVPQRSGLVERLRRVDELNLLLGEAVQVPRQLGLPDVGPRQRGVQPCPDSLRLVGNPVDVLHVRPVGVLLGLAAAAGDPEDEQDDDEDGEADQPD